MADEVKIGIKLRADLSGGMQTREELDRLRKKAKETSNEASGSFAGMSGAIDGVSKAAGLCRKVLSGFGVAGAILGITQTVRKIKESFAAASEEAKKFNEIAAEKKVKESLDALADSYYRLAKSIAEANKQRSAEREIEELEIKANRELEDANIDLAEQRELNEVDEKDPAANELKAEIQARYKEKRDNIAAHRGVEDAERRAWKLKEDEEDYRASAEKIDASAEDTEKALAEARRRYLNFRNESTSNNEYDDQDKIDKLQSSLKQVFTLDWGRLSDYRTEKGDAERERKRQMADQEAETIKRLEQQLAEQRERAEELRKQADFTLQKRVVNGQEIKTQRVRETVSSIKGRADVESAEKATDKIDEDNESAREARINLTRERDALKKRIEEEKERKRTAGKAVFDAQGDLELAKANGDRVGQRSAAASLSTAQDAADEVNHAADAAIEALTKTLKDVESRLKAAQNYLEKSGSQRRAWEAEAPSGSR